MRKVKESKANALNKIKNMKMSLIFILISFLLIAVGIIIIQPQPYSSFQPLEIKLLSYPKQAGIGQYNFTIAINDSRKNQQFVTSIYLDEKKQHQTTLFNGTNLLPVNFTKKGLQKVVIKIYNPENEFNGYGYKTHPFTLSFMVNVK